MRRLAITVRGVVQGVGFRPFVYNAARAESLSGWVSNEADAVRIEVEGGTQAVERFLQTLRQRHPPQARIDVLDIREMAAELPTSSKLVPFQIRASTGDSTPKPTIPADLATCCDCRKEIRDSSERRYAYPFTNCTNCGPRLSIIERLPYDRPRTSMHRFATCEDCRAEYENPTDRRFHAQPIACPACGPRLELLTCEGRSVAERKRALEKSVRAVLAGKILTLKGLGGFQLIVDATDQAAVERLRQRKQRPEKPLAVMLPSLDETRRRCAVSTAEAEVLQSSAAPILLLRRRSDADTTGDVALSVAPGNPYLGTMLPYTPLHHLLMDRIARPIVCTSGNLSEEPMAISTDDAVSRLGRIADLILTHDRPIVRPVDDSVARIGPDGLQILRRARGYAPLPITAGCDLPTVLAVGGHLKNTFALSLGSEVVISPHIGDLDNALAVDMHRRAVDDMIAFFEVTPDAVACDLHPDYASTRHAEELATLWDVPLVRVQHHHAHVVSCVAEHRIDGPVLGLSWDGTGYGVDGTVWGGEILMCENANFKRVAHLRTFPLPSGDRAVREPRRSALGVLHEIMGDDAAKIASEWFRPEELRTLMAALNRPKIFPRTSSLGRLFDAVAALCGLSRRASFEGQAAMALEFAADPNVREAYPLPLSAATPAVADWEPLIRGVLDDQSHGVDIARIAAKFHNALSEMALAATVRAGSRQVMLTGGCFQNALLTDRVRKRLLDNDFKVYTHHEVPPGDGGIALGQLLVAAKLIKGSSHVSGDSGQSH
ncbi:MAG: carbamoyltransferase HypF [Pirellulaceae bacterium]|nr:carbamoyltransferase HypF [Pirellulaceae bacterium]